MNPSSNIPHSVSHAEETQGSLLETPLPRVPQSPAENCHPLMNLPVSSMYDRDHLNSFQKQLNGQPIEATFTDLACVNIANSCGLEKDVDELISKTRKLLEEAYEGSPWLANAPGFDEIFIVSRADQGKNYKTFERAWNKAREEHFPSHDKRVQAAEHTALLREDMYLLQREYSQESQETGKPYSVRGFSTYLESKLDIKPSDKKIEGPLSRLKRAGTLALQVSQQRRADELKLIQSLSNKFRRVLSLASGHVTTDSPLTPHSIRALANHAEQRSTEIKKGIAPAEERTPHATWHDRRENHRETESATTEEVNQTVNILDKYKEILSKLGTQKNNADQLTRDLNTIVYSDRELGEGVIRYEVGKDCSIQTFIDRMIQENESFSLIEIDLTAGGAFTKAFGFSQFGNLFRKIADVIKEKTDAELLIRYGGGKLYVLTSRPSYELGVNSLAEAIDEQGRIALTSDTTRATTARIDYGIRTALQEELSNLLPEQANTSVTTSDFLSSRIRIHLYSYSATDTLEDIVKLF